MMHVFCSARMLVVYTLVVGRVVGAQGSVPDGTLAMPLHRIVNQTAYGVEMKIGTPPQSMKVLIDTGSSFIGLQGTNSNWCQLADKPCAEYGSYDNETSSSARYEDDQFYNSLINHGYGDNIKDIVRVGGGTFPKIEFGMILDYGASYPAPNPNSGLMGLSPLCNNSNCTKGPITTLQQKLVRHGYLKDHVLSIYLGPDEEDAVGSLLFGAVDRAKQKGKVAVIPAIDPTSEIANLSPNHLNFSSMSLEQKAGGSSKISRTGGSGTIVHKFKTAKGAYTLLDSGFPGFSLPTEAWKAIKNYFALHGPQDPNSGAYSVDCEFRKQQSDDATLLVGFADDDLQIRIPLNRLVTQLAPNECVTFVSDCGSNGEGCPFGDAFLRSTYAVFDFDNLTISLSNVRYTDETDIVSPCA